MSLLDDMLRRITDNYNKDPSGNVALLLQVAAEEIEEVMAALETTDDYRDIDQAEGATLDRIGYNVQQWRGQASDAIYRILIKSKIARNLSDGSINTIIRVLSIALDIEPSEVIVEETYAAEPASILVTVPSEALNAVGFSFTNFGRLVNRIVAAGVSATVFFEGTFAFASTLETGNADGFADGPPVTTGGYLGSIYEPADDPVLPI